MQYQVYGSTMQVVDVEINPGEILFSESGAMSWMTPNINMNTNMGNKGFLGGL
ncbi:MAG: AIM24 family protein, partial [Bacillota bacterium]